MHPRTPRWALAVVLLGGFVCVFLLTPAGFETRPIPSIHPLGFAVLAGIFSSVALNVACLLLLRSLPRLAAALVPPGFVLVLVGITIDQVGLFSSFGPPMRISAVEVTFVILELAAVLLAVRVWNDAGARAVAPA
jgi:hypothetical protein